MLEFITQDTKLCPYCKSELTGSNYLMIPPYDYWKECKICNKRFEIAYFVGPYRVEYGDEQVKGYQKEITNES